MKGPFIAALIILVAAGAATFYYLKDLDQNLKILIIVLILIVIGILFYINDRVNKLASDPLPDTKYTYKPY